MSTAARSPLDEPVPLGRTTNPLLPRMPVFGAVAAVVVALVATAAVRMSGVSITEPDAPVLAARALLFADRPDGGVDVIDAGDHRLIETVVGQAGFIRGTMRGLARERHRNGIGADVPFDLIAHVDGRLTLIDPATRRRVDLESFGPTNFGEFARLLPAGSTGGAPAAAPATEPSRN